MLGLSGANSISTTPTVSAINKTFFHDFPPSIDLKIPLCLFGLKGCPIAATKTVLESLGWISTAPIKPALFKPIFSHVLPESKDL